MTRQRGQERAAHALAGVRWQLDGGLGLHVNRGCDQHLVRKGESV